MKAVINQYSLHNTGNSHFTPLPEENDGKKNEKITPIRTE
jgi:hypothetical protein